MCRVKLELNSWTNFALDGCSALAVGTKKLPGMIVKHLGGIVMCHMNAVIQSTLCLGVMESCPSSPLFVPLGMERSMQKTRKLSKDGGALSTDSEDMNGSVKERRHHKRHKGPRSQRGEGKASEESQTHNNGNKTEDKTPSNAKEQLQTSAKKHYPVTENKSKVPGECKSFQRCGYNACERTRPLHIELLARSTQKLNQDKSFVVNH